MAVQISYTFLINGDRYALIGIAGGDRALSKQFGMEPKKLPFANHEGFYGMYELTPAGLYLRGLDRNDENGYYLPIERIDQAKDIDQAFCDDRSALIPFTGKIRLAKDFINQPRVNVAYQKALAFKTVFDITLKEGQVVGVKDRSWEMAQKRDAIKDCCMFPDKLEETFAQPLIPFMEHFFWCFHSL
jgi:hypothetical protein